MAWLIGILKFIFSFVGMSSSILLILGSISSIVNPQMVMEDNKIVEKNTNSRLVLGLVTSIAWAIVIALS